jgi:twitching motility protein PilT
MYLGGAMPGQDLDLDAMLGQATSLGASDMHIRVDMPPQVRVDSTLRDLEGYGPMTDEQVRDLVGASTTEEQKKAFFESKSLDFSRFVPGVARFRCNYFIQQGVMSCAYRRIPTKVPTLAEVGAPEVLVEWARRPRGLVLVTGPTGSGKSTTLAAMIDFINQERHDHILTIEDPIEYVHTPKHCLINQREVGSDTPSFKSALRAALRQDPDVILLGEMRDLETTEIAITAAETGHLVLATLHTSTADSSISRVIDQFPAESQEQIRLMLATSLVGVCTQTLLPRADGRGRVALHEILVANNPVRALIRKSNTEQLRSVMQTGSQDGMQTMDRALAYYASQGIISEDQARSRMVIKEEFERTLADLRGGRKIAAPRVVRAGTGQMEAPPPTASQPAPSAHESLVAARAARTRGGAVPMQAPAQVGAPSAPQAPGAPVRMPPAPVPSAPAQTAPAGAPAQDEEPPLLGALRMRPQEPSDSGGAFSEVFALADDDEGS